LDFGWVRRKLRKKAIYDGSEKLLTLSGRLFVSGIDLIVLGVATKKTKIRKPSVKT